MNKDVSNQLVQNCYDKARKLGALGGKLLGAGEGGFLLLYASPLYQKEISKALNKLGAKQETFKFSQSGLEVWSTKK